MMYGTVMKKRGTEEQQNKPAFEQLEPRVMLSAADPGAALLGFSETYTPIIPVETITDGSTTVKVGADGELQVDAEGVSYLVETSYSYPGTGGSVTLPGQVAGWKLDEGTGPVANDSIGAPPQNGVITGATWVSDVDAQH